MWREHYGKHQMPAPLREPPPHGTRQRYQWRQGPCSCDECRYANRIYKYSRDVINARSGQDRPLFDVRTVSGYVDASAQLAAELGLPLLRGEGRA